jgi:hypothetical protein
MGVKKKRRVRWLPRCQGGLTQEDFNNHGCDFLDYETGVCLNGGDFCEYHECDHDAD